jgi:hypothetical protein
MLQILTVALSVSTTTTQVISTQTLSNPSRVNSAQPTAINTGTLQATSTIVTQTAFTHTPPPNSVVNSVTGAKNIVAGRQISL